MFKKTTITAAEGVPRGQRLSGAGRVLGAVGLWRDPRAIVWSAETAPRGARQRLVPILTTASVTAFVLAAVSLRYGRFEARRENDPLASPPAQANAART